MKSRNDFHNEQDYYDYLLAYYAEQAINGWLSNLEERTSITVILEHIGLPKDTTYVFPDHYAKYLSMISISYAKELIEQLKKEWQVDEFKECDTCMHEDIVISKDPCINCYCDGHTFKNWQPK